MKLIGKTEGKIGIQLMATLSLLQTVQLVHAQVSQDKPFVFSPKVEGAFNQAAQLDYGAAVSFHAGRFAEAEATERQSIALCPFNSGVSEEILAAALDKQGKYQEALQVYRTQIVESKEGPQGQPRILLPYSQLLLKSGQWKAALAAYNNSLPRLPDVGSHPEIPTIHDKEIMRANSHFSSDVPDFATLAVAIHVAYGMVYSSQSNWADQSQDTESMSEYQKALQLSPDSPLTNYYYGQGWQKLSPAERKQFGTAQQAKAALQKAVKLGKGDVKLAAAKALKSFS